MSNMTETETQQMNVVGTAGGSVHKGERIGTRLYALCGTSNKARGFQVTESPVTCEKCQVIR